MSELEKKLDDTRTEITQLKENLVLTEIKLEESKMNLNKTQMELASLEESQQEQKNANVRLKDKVSRLEVMLRTTNTQTHTHTHTLLLISHCVFPSGPAADQCHGELGGGAEPALRGEKPEIGAR